MITRGGINTLLSLTFSRLTFRDSKIFAKSKFREKKLPGQLKTPNLVLSSKKHCMSQLYWFLL